MISLNNKENIGSDTEKTILDIESIEESKKVSPPIYNYY